MRCLRLQMVIAIAGLSLATWGCATKKHVREAIAPVQQQVNQVQKDTEANQAAIGDLDRRVATVDEAATDAGRKAQQATDAAAQANNAAQHAVNRADQANSMAEKAMTTANQVRHELQNLNLTVTPCPKQHVCTSASVRARCPKRRRLKSTRY